MSNQNKTNCLLEFRNISYGYDKKTTTISDISFKIYENEYVCIIGHNGSGKSTISKLLSGLVSQRSGEIFLNGNKITKENSNLLHRTIGVIFQNPDNQFVGLTVRDDIAFSLENLDIKREAIDIIINNISDLFEIKHLLDYPPSLLSASQKQKVAIASIVAINSNAILFDESTSMLDPIAKENLKKFIVNLQKQFKKTIISITHDMEEIVNADRVIILSKGKIINDCSPQELFSKREWMLEHSLDLPYSLRLQNCLINKNHDRYSTLPITTDINELISEICKKTK